MLLQTKLHWGHDYDYEKVKQTWLIVSACVPIDDRAFYCVRIGIKRVQCETMLWSRFVVKTEHSWSFIHAPTARQMLGSKEISIGSQLTFSEKSKTDEKCICPPYCPLWSSVSQWHAGPWEQPGADNGLHYPQCLFGLSVWGYIRSCLVVWVISILSTSLCCVLSRPLAFLSWSVTEELKSPGRFCLPPILVLY